MSNAVRHFGLQPGTLLRTSAIAFFLGLRFLIRVLSILGAGRRFSRQPPRALEILQPLPRTAAGRLFFIRGFLVVAFRCAHGVLLQARSLSLQQAVQH